MPRFVIKPTPEPHTEEPPYAAPPGCYWRWIGTVYVGYWDLECRPQAPDRYEPLPPPFSDPEPGPDDPPPGQDNVRDDPPNERQGYWVYWKESGIIVIDEYCWPWVCNYEEYIEPRITTPGPDAPIPSGPSDTPGPGVEPTVQPSPGPDDPGAGVKGTTVAVGPVGGAAGAAAPFPDQIDIALLQICPEEGEGGSIWVDYYGEHHYKLKYAAFTGAVFLWRGICYGYTGVTQVVNADDVPIDLVTDSELTFAGQTCAECVGLVAAMDPCDGGSSIYISESVFLHIRDAAGYSAPASGTGQEGEPPIVDPT